MLNGMRTCIKRPASVIHHNAVFQHKKNNSNPSIIETSVRKLNQPEFSQKLDSNTYNYLP